MTDSLEMTPFTNEIGTNRVGTRSSFLRVLARKPVHHPLQLRAISSDEDLE
jgi:hypothetical protein